MSQTCQCTHDREDHGFYFIDGVCHKVACKCKRYNPAPQEAPEAKRDKLDEKCTCGHLRRDHLQSNPTPHLCMEDGCNCKNFKELDPIRAAADKMAEAADEVLIANVCGSSKLFDRAMGKLSAALSDYQKAVGK